MSRRWATGVTSSTTGVLPWWSTRHAGRARSSGRPSEEEVEIVAVADTHVHNDYVCGALGLARRHGADYLLAADEAGRVRAGRAYATATCSGTARSRSRCWPPRVTPATTSPSWSTPPAVRRRCSPAEASSTGPSVAPTWSTPGWPAGSPRPSGPAPACRPSSRRSPLLHPTHGFGSFCAAGTATASRHGALDRRAARHSPRPHHRQGDLRDRSGRGLRPRPRPLRPHGPAQPEGRRQRSGPPHPSRDGRAGHRRRAGRRVGGGPAGPLRLRQRARPRHGERGVRQAVRDVRRLAGAVGRRDPAADGLAHASRAGPAGPGRHRDRRCHRPGADRRRHGDGELPARRLDRLPRMPRTSPSSSTYATVTSGRAVTCPVPCTSRSRTSTSPGRRLPSGELWVHCQSGYRAGIAASLLHRMGRDVVHIDDSWDRVRELAIQTTQEAA